MGSLENIIKKSTTKMHSKLEIFNPFPTITGIPPPTLTELPTEP